MISGERRADPEHEAEGAEQHEQVGRESDQAVREQALHRVDVRADAGHQAADGVAVEIAEGQAQDLAEDVGPHVEEDALARARRQIALHEAQEEGGEADEQIEFSDVEQPAPARSAVRAEAGRGSGRWRRAPAAAGHWRAAPAAPQRRGRRASSQRRGGCSAMHPPQQAGIEQACRDMSGFGIPSMSGVGCRVSGGSGASSSLRGQPLHFVEFAVVAGLGDQFRVGAVLRDAAVLVQDEDAVGVAQGGDAVADQDGGAPAQFGEQLLQDLGLGLGVHGGEDVVENEQGGSRARARPMAVRWRWPPDRVTPRSPSRVR
jgi:hypothetical protein